MRYWANWRNLGRKACAALAAFVAGTAVWAVGPSPNPRGAESRRIEPKSATENVGELYALLVGVDDYGGTLKTLRYAGSDVERIAGALEKIGFPSDNIRKFVSGAGEASRPSRERILAALDEIVRKSGPNSTVFVAFSGHGFETVEDGAAAFCPTDVRVEFGGENGDEPYVLKDSAILMTDVVEKLQKDDANFKMLIVDACREPAATADGVARRGGVDSRGGAPKGGGADAFAKIDASGLAFLQSCGSREFSWEDKKLGGGIFTYYFVEGLGGAASTTGDGVTFQEVCGYARRKTTERTQELGVWLQRPFGRFKSAEGAAELDSDFYLIAPKKPKEAAAKLAEAKELRASGGLANLRSAWRLLDEARGLYRYMDATKEAVVAEREALAPELASALADEAREKLDVEAFDDAVSLAKEAVDAFESLKNPNDEEPPFVPPKYRDLLTKCERRRDAWRLLDEAENALGAGNRATAASKVERSLALWDSPRGRDMKAKIEKAETELPEDYLSAAGIEFRLIKPGSFMMGNTLTPEEIHAKYPGGSVEWYRDAPRHKVTLTEPFYMAKYETTVAEFKRFVDETGYKTTAEEKGNAWELTQESGWRRIDDLNWLNPGVEQDSTHPVVYVTWYDAQEYIKWLNDNAEYSEELGFKPVYRLPTEAEWEYACRAGSKTEFFWGSDELEDGEGYLNAADKLGTPIGTKWSNPFPFNDGYVATSPVGKFKPNAWGLYDMAGNAWEWCADWYDPYDAMSQKDPKGPKSGSFRVLRGGSWSDGALSCRSAARYGVDPTARGDICGFRLVLGRALPGEATSTQRQAQNGGTSPSTGTDSSLTSTGANDWSGEYAAGTLKSLTVDGITYNFRYCPASEKDRSSDETQHRVTLDGFWMLETEVTVGMWRSFVKATNYKMQSTSGFGYNASKGELESGSQYTWDNPGFSQTDAHPVTLVDWYGAVAFGEWLAKESGLPIRLPSKAEWDYACRAGSTSAYSFGSDAEELTEYGNVADASAKGKLPEYRSFVSSDDGYVFTAPVKQFKPNAWNLYDMHGNVREWCLNRYAPKYLVEPRYEEDLQEDHGIVRGGSWYDKAETCELAASNRTYLSSRDSGDGFRLALVRPSSSSK